MQTDFTPIVNAHNVSMSANAESEARIEVPTWEMKKLEVPVESVGTVAEVQSWRQRIPDFRRCDREATVRANGTMGRC